MVATNFRYGPVDEMRFDHRSFFITCVGQPIVTCSRCTDSPHGSWIEFSMAESRQEETEEDSELLSVQGVHEQRNYRCESLSLSIA